MSNFFTCLAILGSLATTVASQAQTQLNCPDLFIKGGFPFGLGSKVYSSSMLGAGSLKILLKDQFRVGEADKESYQRYERFLREIFERTGTGITFLREGSYRKDLVDRTPLSDVFGGLAVSAEGNTVSVTEKGSPGPATPAREALALTVDGGIHKVPFDSGSTPNVSIKKVTSFQTEAPVRAVKAFAINKSTIGSRGDIGVFAIDQNGSIYFQILGTNKTMTKMHGLGFKIKKDGRALLPEEVAKIPLQDILPTNLVLTREMYEVSGADYGTANFVHVRFEIQYLSQGGYDVSFTPDGHKGF